jgi:hypothetical protein
MARSTDEANRRATRINPTRSGMRTGNPQLEAHEGDEVRSSPRQRTPRPRGKQLRPKPRRQSDAARGSRGD